MDKNPPDTDPIYPSSKPQQNTQTGKQPAHVPGYNSILPPPLRRIWRDAYRLGALEVFATLNSSLVFASERTHIEGDPGAWLLIRFAPASAYYRGIMFQVPTPSNLTTEIEDYINLYLALNPGADYQEIYSALLNYLPEAAETSLTLDTIIKHKIHQPPNLPPNQEES